MTEDSDANSASFKSGLNFDPDTNLVYQYNLERMMANQRSIPANNQSDDYDNDEFE